MSKKICSATEDVFLSYNWPGNVRELSNMIERTVITASKSTINPDDLPDPIKNYRRTSKGIFHFVTRFSFDRFKVTRVRLELLDAPAHGADTYGVAMIYGITLVNR